MTGLTSEDAKNMKVTELKAALKERGAPLSGKKDDLMKRLLKMIEEEEDSEEYSLPQTFGTELHSPAKVESDEIHGNEMDVPKSADPNENEANSLVTEKEISAVDPVHETAVIPAPVTTVTPAPETALTPAPETALTPAPETALTPAPETAVIPAPETAVTTAPETAVISKPLPIISAVVKPTESVPVPDDNPEEEEDEEQRELREVEERKLREAVKLSMARQAVKKSMISTDNTSAKSSSSKNITSSQNISNSTSISDVSTTTHISSHDSSTTTTIHSENIISSTSTTSLPVNTVHTDKSTPINIKTEYNNKSLSMKSTSPSNNIPPHINPVSKHLRIDNFQRPLKLNGLHTWLEDRCGHSIHIDNIWLNSIKTHGYVSFDTEEQATHCREAVYGQNFPPGSPLTLTADFTTVSAKDAQNSNEAQLKFDAWIKNVKSTTTTPRGQGQSSRTSPMIKTEDVNANMNITITTSDELISTTTNAMEVEVDDISSSPRQSQAQAQALRRKLGGGAQAGGAILGMLKNAATNAANSAKHIRSDKMAVNIDGNETTGFSTRRFRGEDTSTATSGSGKRVRELEVGDAVSRTDGPHVKRFNDGKGMGGGCDGDLDSLETYFKKTKVTPCLYWMPVSNEEVEKRIRIRSA
eukprot:gene5491-11044_t